MKRWIEVLRKKKWIGLTIIGVFLIGFGGLLARSKLAKATKNEGAPEIRTATVERGDIALTIDATGTIKPLNIVEVSSKASGKILELTVEPGDYVEKDAVIARIETTYVSVDLEQAEADLRAAKARLEQSEINIELQKKQSAIQIKQAQEQLAEASKQLEQLKEQITIEKKTNQRQLVDAENSLEMARLRYKLQTSETVRKEDIKRAEASVTQAQANRDLAQKEYERKQALFEKKYISKADLDAAETQWKSAQAQYESAVEQAEVVKKPASEAELKLLDAEIKKAELAVDAAREQIEKEKYRDMEIEIQGRRVTQAEKSLELALANEAQIVLREKDLESAKAQLTRNESQLQLAQESFEDTIIRAPISGTILEKRVEEGQVITSRLSSLASSEGQVIATMADLSKVYVVTEVDETDIGKVKVGQPVTITIEAYPDQPFEGEILRIAPQGQVVQNVTTFEVITEIKNTRSRQRGSWGRGGAFSGEKVVPQGQLSLRGEGGAFRRDGGMVRSEMEAGGQGERREGRNNNPQSEIRNPQSENPQSSDPWLAMMDSFVAGEAGATRESEPVEETTTPFLKPGMNASVEISAASKQNVLLLANEAILSFGNRKMVRVIGEDGQPGRPQPITAGVSGFDKTEIISGLEEGQVVAIGGPQSGGPGGRGDDFRRQMMQNPASTMQRMQGGFGPGGGGQRR